MRISINKVFRQTGRVLGLILCLSLFLIHGNKALGQTLYGTIVGTVTDSSGSVVPGAVVTATQIQTSEIRTAKANESGVYTLSTLPAGTYSVKVTAPGFSTFEANNIALTINATARVNAALTVGAASQTVTIVADTAELQTDRIDVHANVTSEQLEELPQPTRTYEGLLGLLPGVAPPNPQWAGGGGTNNPDRSMIINVNGTSASGTAVSVDGVSAYNPWVQFYSTAVPSTDAIQTVNTVTASSGADQGIMNGGGVRIQIKSGTNDFHGSVYWYNVNNAAKARPYNTPSTYRKPKYIDNDLGGTIGGRIIRNKLFFFGSYEGDPLHQAQGGFFTLPTPDMAKGILASSTPIFDPQTGNPDGSNRTPFSRDANGNYIIPSNRITDSAKTLLGFLPTGVPNGVFNNNIYINTPYTYTLQKIDSKIDWNTTDKLRISGRFSTYPYDNKVTPALGNILGPGNGSNTDQHGSIYSTSIMATYIATPNLVIDALFGFTKTNQYLFPSEYSTRFGEEKLGIPNSNVGPLPSAGGVPQFRFNNGLNQFGYSYPALSYKDPIFQYSGNVTWVKKNHSIRFGIDISQQHINHQEVTPTYFNFTGNVTKTFCSGCTGADYQANMFSSFADFLLGLPQSESNSELTTDWVTLRTWQFAPYVSDTWQVTPKLTAYVGSGWDFLPVPKRDGRGIEFYDTNTNTFEFCGVGGVSSNCGISVQKTLFAPRAGIAYRIRPNTVFRAGYSLAPEQINMARDMLYNYPSTFTQTISGSNSYLPAASVTAGFPTLSPPAISSGKITLPSDIGVAWPTKNFNRGYTESYNVTVQRSLGWDTLAQIGYVGTLTIHQHTRANINFGQVGGGQASEPLFQKFGVTAPMTQIQAYEHMNYKSLQAQIQKNFGNGLQFTAAYTYSKWMGLCCDEQGDGAPQILIPQFMHLTWALMPDDRTHNFELSGVYQLPFGKGKRYAIRGVASALAGGWQTNWVFSRYSGTPFTVTASDASLNAPGNSQIADKVKSSVKIDGVHGLYSKYFDTTAFAGVDEVRFGNAGFNSLRGPGYGSLEFSVFRTFPIKDTLKMQFRTEALNLTNHPNFGNPDSNVNSSTFGEITGTTTGSRLIAERYFRFGLKATF